MLRVFCPSCKTPFDVDQGLIGQKGLCPTCGAKFIIARQEGIPEPKEGCDTQPIVEPEPPQPPPDTVKRPPAKGLGLALLIASATGAAYWALANGKVPESRWLEFSGRLHPLMVHFPAAIIPALALVQLFSGDGKSTRILLWINFLACCGAILAGFASGADRGPSEDLRLHTLFGLGTAVLSFFMLIFHTLSVKPLFLMNLVAALGCVFGAGHFGANMSHGDILKNPPWEPEAAKTQPAAVGVTAVAPEQTNAAESLLGQAILPIFNARCVSCHGADKAKGDLRLDSYQAMLLAGESGKPSIIGGNTAQSESLVRMAMALDDEEHMPPAKKPQPTPEEVEILTWWVQNGASATLAASDASIPGPIAEKVKSAVAALPK